MDMNTYAGVVSLVAVLSTASVSVGADWPQWRGPHRDGRSAETGLLQRWPTTGPEQRWVCKGLGAGFASVSVVDGRIYTTGMIKRTGVLFAIGLDGKVLWQKPYGPEWRGGHKGVRCTPTVHQGVVYVMSGRGQLVCFDARTGEQKWTVDTVKEYRGKIPGWGIAESPLVIGDHVIATPGGPDASVVAVERLTGKPVWQSRGLSEKSAYCSPILVARGDRGVIVTMTAKHVVGLDAHTGRVLWRRSHHTSYDVHAVTPLYLDGHVYVTSGYGTGGVLLKLADDGGSVTQQWQDKSLDNHHGGVVLVDGHIYGSTYGGSWVCLDPKTGRATYKTRGIGKGSVIYGDGRLYCYAENGTLALVKPTPKGFDVVSRFRVREGSGSHWAHPAIADRRLYIRHGDALMAYDIQAPKPAPRSRLPKQVEARPARK